MPYTGIHVRQPTAEELRDVAEVRVSVEIVARCAFHRDPKAPRWKASARRCRRT
jgi:DNA-binding GntR family transcriptional regulator